MRVYHRTFHSEAILSGGFRDGRGKYLTDQEQEGVWLSDRPLGDVDGATGDTYLVLDIPQSVLLDYEWIEGLGFREFLVPAAIVNSYGTPEIHEEPDFILCTVTLGDGSICGSEATTRDEDGAFYMCADHADPATRVFDEDRNMWRVKD